MPIAWFPKRSWNFCMSEDEKKIEQILLSNAFNVYNLRVKGYFTTWKLDIVFPIWFFETFCPKYILKKYLKEFITQRLDIVENMLILSSPKISQGAKCVNILKPKNISGDKIC